MTAFPSGTSSSGNQTHRPLIGQYENAHCVMTDRRLRNPISLKMWMKSHEQPRDVALHRIHPKSPTAELRPMVAMSPRFRYDERPRAACRHTARMTFWAACVACCIATCATPGSIRPSASGTRPDRPTTDDLGMTGNRQIRIDDHAARRGRAARRATRRAATRPRRRPTGWCRPR